MPAVKTYTRVNFQNYPSTSTPLNATNLNKMDKGIDDLDDEVVAVKNTIENMSFDADSISYNNTSSGLQATDVQGAVDEINDNLTASNQTAGVTDVPFRFGCNDEGEFGYIINQGGADSVIPFRKNANFIQIADSETTSYTITQNDVDNYKQIIIIGQSSTGGGSSISMSATNVDISFTSYNSHSQTTSGVGVFVRNNLVAGDIITVNKGNGMYLKLMVLGVKY